MNYIKQLNEFHFKIDLEPISVHARSLWYTLTDINNRLGWREEFTVAASKLSEKAGLSDSSFKRARKELEDNGYIQVTSRSGNRAALYKMICLYENVGHYTHDSTPQQSQNLDHKLDENVDPLIKQKQEMKQNNKTTTTTDAIAFFQDNFGAMMPYVANDMLQWVADLGEPLVMHAMKRALDQGKNNWGYVKGILRAWTKKGITEIDAANEEARDYQTVRERKVQSYDRGGSDEVVPDWFRELKRKEKWKREHAALVVEVTDPIAAEKEMEELLKKIKSGSNAYVAN